MIPPQIKTPSREETSPRQSLTRRLRRRLGVRRRARAEQPAPAPSELPPPSAAYVAALAALAPSGTQVGSAAVLSVEEGRARVLLADGRQVTPTWALPYAYTPRVGDTLWVISRAERHYVLGVERGSGTSLLWFPGDVALRAKGRLRLSARRALRLTGDQVTLRAELLERVAEALESSTRESSLRLKGLLRTVAQRVQRVVEEVDGKRAGRVQNLALDLVKIDAELIKLQ